MDILNLEEAFEGQSILVTGGSGYLATNLISALNKYGCRVLRLSRPGAVSPAVPPGKARLENLAGDIRERSVWERALAGVDIVFHLAAQTSVPKSDQYPCDDFQANVLPMVHLLETCRLKGWKPGVLFAGTVTQVGVTRRCPVDESFPDVPVSAYDRHKLSSEDLLKDYARGGIVKGATLRLANVYGPGPKSSSPDRGILNAMARKAIAGETLTIYGSGECTRDYIFVEDVVSAFLHAAMHMDRVNGRHFIIGSEEGRAVAAAIRAVAECVESRIGKKVSVQHVPPPGSQSPIETRDFVANTARFRAATGWSPRVGFAEGVQRTVDNILQESLVA